MKHIIKTNSLVVGTITTTTGITRAANGSVVAHTFVKRGTSPLTLAFAIAIGFFSLLVIIAVIAKL